MSLFKTKKEREAFLKRLIVLLIVYLMVMTGVWSALNFLFFPNGLKESWQIWLFVGLSILLFAILVAVIETQHARKRMSS